MVLNPFLTLINSKPWIPEEVLQVEKNNKA